MVTSHRLPLSRQKYTRFCRSNVSAIAFGKVIANVLYSFSYGGMRFDRDRLTFLALCVLDDVCYRCQRGPVQASPPIRLALAVLYALGSGPKQLFDDFWREMRNPYSEQSHPSQGNTLRANYATTYFAGIARSVGVDLSMDYERRLAGARKEREVVAP